MGLDFDYILGQTPLNEEEKEGLLIHSIGTRNEIDEYEQQNIEKAIQWAMMNSFKNKTILIEVFIRNVHKRMFNNIWIWAGKYRKTDKNIGIEKWQISTELKTLLDDANYWIENNTYSPDEIALRFKHRLVSIHCFPNGNGRHSRLMADIIIEKIYKMDVFSWDSNNLSTESDARTIYLEAVKAADKGAYKLLIAFARS